jgi:putative addiction module component (TIGR02574 family)
MRTTFAVQRPGMNVHRAGVARDADAIQTDHMPTTGFDISKLSIAERIQLAEDLWDSVAAETGDLPLTEAQAAELDRRLADLERNPQAGESWSVVRARIEQRLDKAG